mgnify:CR=1 FL=1
MREVTMKEKLKKIITIPRLNLLMVLIIFGFTAYTMFVPLNPATYDKPVVQDVNNIRAGKQFTYTLHSCRRVGESVVTTVTRKLVSVSNSSLAPITLTSDTLTNKVGCIDSRRSLVIPYSTPEGKYQLVISGVYQIIPLRAPVTVTATSDPFNVKKANTENSVQMLIQENTQLQTKVEELTKSDVPVADTIVSAQPKVTTNNVAFVQKPVESKPAPIPTPAPEPQKPTVEWTYKVVSSAGVQLGVYNLPANAVIKYNFVSGNAKIYNKEGVDVTNQLITIGNHK